MQTFFADVILPLPIEARFTYRVPQVLNGRVAFGMRVIVPFGSNKLYAAIVEKVHEDVPKQVSVKYLLDVIDERLDGLEDLLRDVRRALTGRRSAARDAESVGRGQSWQE